MTHWKAAAALCAALGIGGMASGCASSGNVPGRTEARAVDDATITTGVQAAIGKAPELQAADIDVATREGIVRLSGYVSSAENVATAASVARTVKGVKSVYNDLRLK